MVGNLFLFAVERPVKKPEKPMPVPAPAPVKMAKAPVPGAVPAAAVVKKKSTVSRREELLKQLKAVEDAIAKKRSKMN